MNSYGDHSSARARVQVPGGYQPEDEWPGNGRYSAPDGPVSPAPAGRASASVPSGRASASVPPGRASAAVPSGRASASVPSGRASAGRAAVARAAVPTPAYDGYDDDLAGRGSAGTAVAGRASVGRASVRPVSPAIGGPGGPGDVGNPGGRGPGGPGGRGPGGRGPGGLSPSAAARAKKRKRINLIIGAFAVLIMLAGGAVVGVTYYSTQVPLPTDKDLVASFELSSTLLYAGGKREIAKLGEVNRVYTKIDKIPDHVERAVASAEDRKFYEHEGIDYLGIMRAAWNNFTGGDQQGASTITQQYARNALDLTGVTYARKAREAVLASKLNDNYTKDQIMEYYLNTIYFGRGAYSIEAASQAYFKKPVDKLTVAEGAVLAAVIKQPVPSETHKGYDPSMNPEAAQDRWQYVIDGMNEKGWMPADAKAPLEYPEVQPWDEKKARGLEVGLNTPAGYAINYVTRELAEMVDPTTGKKICQPNACLEAIRTGGLRITTSLDYEMQKAAVDAASRRKGSELDGKKANLKAALVSIDPENGRVLAYYGAEKSTDLDFAGVNYEKGEITGGHPPGSSFKVYTLAAALKNNISLQSHWDSTPFTNEAGNDVSNAAANPCKKWCSLEESTVRSLNVPFYRISETIGADKVVDMAKAAGIRMMWGDKGRGDVVDLTTVDASKVAPSKFFHQVGFGQYGVTVLDHANGLATLAAGGIYNKAHFVVKVERKNIETGEYELIGGEQLQPERRIDKGVADDVTATLAKIPGNNGDSLRGGREAAGKTGTWELTSTKKKDRGANADAWMVGYTPQIATAVWIGSADYTAIRDESGNIGGSGLPADIWKRFMNKAHDGMKKVDLPEAANVGDDDAGNGKSPEPKQPDCPIPFVPCGDDDGGQDNGGQNGGQNNGGGNNNGGNNGPGTLPGLPPDPNADDG